MGLDRTGGGRATSASQLDMFTKSVRYLANLICDYFNLFLIPKMVAYNFDTDKFPKLSVRSLGETRDLQQFAAALANLANQKLFTVDDATERWIRRQFDMPQLQGERPVEVPVAAPNQTGAANAQNGQVGPNNQPQQPQPPPQNGQTNRGSVTSAIKGGNVPKGTNPS